MSVKDKSIEILCRNCISWYNTSCEGVDDCVEVKEMRRVIAKIQFDAVKDAVESYLSVLRERMAEDK